jgi:hypothetical protein
MTSAIGGVSFATIGLFDGEVIGELSLVGRQLLLTATARTPAADLPDQEVDHRMR